MVCSSLAMQQVNLIFQTLFSLDHFQVFQALSKTRLVMKEILWGQQIWEVKERKKIWERNHSGHDKRSALRKERRQEGGLGRKFLSLWHNSEKAASGQEEPRNSPEQVPHSSQFWALSRPREVWLLYKQNHESIWGCLSAMIPAAEDMSRAFSGPAETWSTIPHHLLTFTNSSKFGLVFISTGEILLLTSLPFSVSL